MGTVNGCCVKAQFSMDVVTEDDKTIIVDIKYSHSQEPAHFAREIFYQVHQTNTVTAGFDGKFIIFNLDKPYATRERQGRISCIRG